MGPNSSMLACRMVVAHVTSILVIHSASNCSGCTTVQVVVCIVVG